MEAYATLFCCAACGSARRGIMLRESLAAEFDDATIREIDHHSDHPRRVDHDRGSNPRVRGIGDHR
jgi:hypothetical protein